MSDQEIIAAYEAGADCDAVGFNAGIHPQTVRAILRHYGTTLRPPQRGRQSAKPVPEEELCKRYQAGESGVALADAYGVSTGMVYSVLRRHGIERRDFRTLTRQRHARQKAARMGGGNGGQE
jgi:hypothetical protein